MERYVAFLRGMNLGKPADQERRAAGGVRGARLRRRRHLPRQRQRDLRPGEAERGGADEDGSKPASARRSATKCRSSCAAAPRSPRSPPRSRSTAKRVAASKGKLQVSLLAKKPTAAARKKVLALATDEDRLAIEGRELFWLPSGGTIDSELDLKAIEKALGKGTMRTMGTIEQIAAKLSTVALAPQCGSSGELAVGAGEGGDLDVAADGADLVRQLGELDVGDELQVLAERAEEVVVVGGDDGARVEPGQDPLPVVVGEAAAGDAGEEDVDVALADRLVDEVGAALVVEAQPGDGDRDAPDLAAAVGAGGERVEVLAGQFAVVGDGEAEQQLRVDAGREADLERARARRCGRARPRPPARRARAAPSG